MSTLVRFSAGLAARVMAVVFAVAAMQFPVYYTAYANTVAGARLEAQMRYQELTLEASKLQLSVEEFIQHHENNPDAVFHASGRIHRTTLEHYQRYIAMDTALSTALVWRKPLVLAQNFDRDLYEVTHFEPALVFTPEAGAYALAGLLLAWLLSSLGGVIFLRQPAARSAVR